MEGGGEMKLTIVHFSTPYHEVLLLLARAAERSNRPQANLDLYLNASMMVGRSLRCQAADSETRPALLPDGMSKVLCKRLWLTRCSASPDAAFGP